jgi:hypothetical protein
MQPNDAGSVSAVPSGSAGEPTPTTDAKAHYRHVREWYEVAGLSDEAVARAMAEVDALLSAVAAAATAQTVERAARIADVDASEAEMIAVRFDSPHTPVVHGHWMDRAKRARKLAAELRALAGGAPQGVSDAPTDDCPGCSHAKTLHGDTGCDAPYCRCRAMAGHFDA